MPYVITTASGEPVVIPDQEINDDFSVDLVGRNYQDYGQVVAQNTLRLLENYASNSPPRYPTTGQVWYDTANDVLRVWEQNTQSWTPITTLVSDQEPPRTLNQTQQDGVMYFNTDDRKLYININQEWQETFTLGDVSTQFEDVVDLGYPTRYGSRIRTIYLYDIDAGVRRAVLALTYVNNGTASTGFFNDEKIIAIFSGHTFAFNVDDRVEPSITEDTNVSYYAELGDINGIGTTIQPGLNLRKDNLTRVEYSDLAHSSNVAFALNTGSSSFNGANIAASNVFHRNIDNIPGTDDTFALGNASTVFSDVYATNFHIGNGTSGNIIPNGNSVVTLGTANASISEIFVTDITVGGNITVNAATDFGSNTTPIENIYAETITANTVVIDGYTMPETSGNTGQQMYIDASDNVFWFDPASNISQVYGGVGLTWTRTSLPNIGPSGEIAQEAVTIAVGAGPGILTNASNIEVNLGDFTSNDLPEGANALYFTTTRARNSVSAGNGIVYSSSTGEISVDNSEILNLLSVGSGLDYDSANGIITLTYSTNFDESDPSDFVQITGSQTVLGAKTFNNTVTLDGTDLVLTSSGITYQDDPLVFTGDSGSVTFSNNGDVTASGDLTAFSDQSLKTELAVITDALERVKSLTGYTFSRTDKPGRHTGLIAQHVEEVLPEAVSEVNDLKTVAYGNMMGLVVEAIKELSEKVNAIQNRLDDK